MLAVLQEKNSDICIKKYILVVLGFELSASHLQATLLLEPFYQSFLCSVLLGKGLTNHLSGLTWDRDPLDFCI
jgi:hypothetical protein